MYLNQLNETEKTLFLQLACGAAMSDGIYAEKERQIMTAYCAEMGINADVSAPQTADIDAVIERINEISSEKSKKIIYFEIIGLMTADFEYHIKEKEFADRLKRGLRIDGDFDEKCVELLNEYFLILDDMNQLVL